ncbi:SDR family NAD(P)-dependent oxidoreductase [Hoeflea prorocentri]|uniref:SDR family NAD(P)-dependent oxidoreductase n=1 Tax=Hoeflea prorocentri TaxID=1922333 RepID=A0A9X3UJ11_9HYPH|nr:SDR family oxidoreductase [Hoeflea prorocentri]MCY6382263.1 SDR family NAD(P)-dependent oxidoreductase [Hoeflea prorocentri]MDA5400063.1 SDR family NAD(P)-dependent oxidoreductase [Hoeflea prorocentri]
MKALVTGAAAGLGLALTQALLARGAQVVAIDRETMDQAEGLVPLTCDLSDRAAVDGLLPRIVAEGPFDLVVHNAGISATGKFEEIPADAYGRLLTVNLETPMVMTAFLLKNDCLTGRGQLVFISSLSHATGYPGGTVYAASKDALAVYACSIAGNLKKKGIHVMAVFPGPLRTVHAERHAPPGADAQKRMDPAAMAQLILSGAKRRRSLLYPGMPATIGRIAGMLMPGLTTRIMRRVIFEKLDHTVY